MRGLHVRRKVLPSRTIAAEPRGDARATTGLCAFGVRRTKVLREKVHCRSLSSIHMDYNQPLVGGPSVHPTPARAIGNVSLWTEGTDYLLILYYLRAVKDFKFV